MLLPTRIQRRDLGPEEERVRGHKKIVALLRQLESDHELLSVTVPGCPDVTNTAILGVREESGYLLLDEFRSSAANKIFSECKKAIIRGRLKGTELSFSCRLIKTGADSNIILYAVRIPGEIIRKQRRNQFRLRLSPALSVPVTLPDIGGHSVTGEAYDLSASGLGALLNTNSCPQRGELLSGVTLFLPGSKPFITTLEVRYARLESARRNMLRIGARFIALTQQQERKLEQFLAEQQRKRCRHDAL